MSETDVTKLAAAAAAESGDVESSSSQSDVPAPADVRSTALTPSEPVAGSSLMATSPDENGIDKTPQKPSKGIMNLNKSDLVRLLGLLEAELQARDFVITRLKAERSKVLRPARNNQRYTLANPYAALGRDDGDDCDNEGKDPGTINANNDPVACLQALVEQHKKAEQQMRAQMDSLRLSHDRTLKQLDMEKRKHAQDTAQGDDVTYLLEKERERLAQQLDFEKAQQKKMEKETKRNQQSLAQERKRHLQFAKAMMEERKILLLELNETKQRAEELEKFVLSERLKLRQASQVAIHERRRAGTMEAEMERQLSEFDIEREQLSAKLNREENRTKELREELGIVTKRIEELEKASAASAASASSSSKVQKNGPAKQDTSSPRAVNGIREARDRLTKTSRNPMPSVKPSKIYTVKGFQSPRAAAEKGEKSEGSSSGSEELPSPLSPNSGQHKPVTAPNKPKPTGSKPNLTNSKSVELDSPRHSLNKTNSPRSSPAPGSGLVRAKSERNKSSMSPASSLDRLSKPSSGKSSLSPASSLDRLTKTGSRKSALSPASSLEKLTKADTNKKSTLSQASSYEKLTKTGGKTSLSAASSLEKLTKSSSLDKLSKSSSLDKLSKIGVGSPPTQKSSKIPSSTSLSSASGQRGSQGSSSNIFSPQKKAGSSDSKSTSEPGKLTRVNSPSTSLNSLPQKPNLNGSPGLTRPTALSSPGSRGDSARSSFRKIPAPGWPLSGGSPSTSPTKPFEGISSTKGGSSWRKTPSSTNNTSPTQPGTTKAASSPPQQGKPSVPASVSTSVPTSNGLQPPGKTSPPGQSSPQQPNGQIPKKPPSPRGTPPPIPPNKPTLIPQKSNATTPVTTSVTTVTSPESSQQQKPDSNKNTTFPMPPPVTTMGLRKSESLVEARKQFYNNKLGSSSTNNISPRPPLDNYHLVCANTNANNSNDGNKTICNANEEPACCGPIVDNSPATRHNAPSQFILRLSCPPHPCGTSSITKLPAPSANTASCNSPLHQAARQGDTATICRLIEEQHSPNSLEDDGSTPVHVAAETGQLDCLDLLLDLGGDFNAKRTDGYTCVQGAAAEGQEGCLSSLLDRGANPNVSDAMGWTPLHLAVSYGHAECVRILLDHGAFRNCYNKTGWSALHCAVRHNQIKCLKILLAHKAADDESNQPLITDIDNITNQTDNRVVSVELLNAQDQDGWTIAHVLASKGQKDNLEFLCRYGGMDLEVQDRWRRTPYDVATDTCKEFLNAIEGKKVRVIIDVSASSSNYNKPPSPGGKEDQHPKQFVVGRVVISPGMMWPDFDNAVATVLTNHSRDLEGCPKDDSDSDSDSRCSSDEGSDVAHELGLGANSIHCYVAGNLQWNVGETPTMAPSDLFNLTSEIIVRLRGLAECSLDQLAYDSLIPTQTLQNYVRLIEQYKSVVLYGPPGSGKTHVAFKIAEFIRIKLQESGYQSSITYVTLHNKFTQQDLAKLLCNKGFFLPAVGELEDQQPIKSIPILVLDDISKVPTATVLGELMDGLEHRGPQHTTQLPSLPGSGSFYLHGDCIVIATMDKSSSGMDLSVQQRFRWIRLHWDREPVQSMLSRHLVRRLISKLDGRLPPSDDPTYRAIEWVSSVWYKLNECFLRLPLPGTVLGPKHFFTCPIDADAPKSIMRWLCLLWNHAIAPSVEDTLRKTASKSKTANEQNTEKLAITALYVLLQRAVFPGCPLSNEESEEYLSTFRGYTEPNIELTPQRLNSLRRSRRSKSLDRSKTSNKAKALMAKQQAAALDLISTSNTDQEPRNRSMIPRRVAVSSSTTVKTKSQIPKLSTNSPRSDANSNHTDSILTSEEEEDLLESLLSLQGSQSDSEIDRLIQLQDRLFGGSPTKKMLQKRAITNGSGPKRKREANETGKPVKRSNGDEDGVWEVWEETV
ncbi:uncharacterized protein [Amphiura filiformis]|uniref:uncharacterized protein isoform X2 n=1 Tax=Amphiura filiformis TaxID=82378 RepID=UPI003B2107F5